MTRTAITAHGNRPVRVRRGDSLSQYFKLLPALSERSGCSPRQPLEIESARRRRRSAGASGEGACQAQPVQ